MKFTQQSSKTIFPPSLKVFILMSSSICIVYLVLTLLLVGPPKFAHVNFSLEAASAPTSLEHIVFGIAATQKSWTTRKEYIRIWWKPHQMRGCVFLESLPPTDVSHNNDSLPPICVSEDTSRFRYTYRGGSRSAIRVARVVLETVRLNHTNVRWYVFGDDDTIFFPENLVKTLSKYDHGLWYYIGTNSEIYEQNTFFGFNMAFGGAGFAISHPLALVLAKYFDSCIERYPHLYGSDGRVYTCLAELGVGLTHEPGFHQVDVRGDLFGLLTSHPVRPLVSLHHLEYLEPIFPNMTVIHALHHLFEAVNIDSQRVMQQTVCYNHRHSWTVSVSWGYAVQVSERHDFLSDVLSTQHTFRQWKVGSKDVMAGMYTFNTREYHSDPCRRPTVFFMHSVSTNADLTKSTYFKKYENCTYGMASAKKLEEVRVFSRKLNLDVKQLLAPRRHCCEVLKSSSQEVLEIAVRECRHDELINMRHA